MGKRSRRDRDSKTVRKRRRLLQKLSRLDRDSSRHRRSVFGSVSDSGTPERMLSFSASDTTSDRGNTPDSSRNIYFGSENSVMDIPAVRDYAVTDENLSPNLPREALPLSADVLKILGCDKDEEDLGSKAIRKELATSWSELIKSKLSDQARTDLLSCYLPPSNLKALEPPKLNLEVAAAINEPARNRDMRLLQFQKQLGSSLSALGYALSSLLEQKGEADLRLVQPLSDAGKLLADLFSSYSSVRKELVSLGLKKELKETLNSVEVDTWLFGTNLDERVKASKNLEKISQELKPVKATTSSNRVSKNFKGTPHVNRVRRDQQPFRQPTRQYRDLSLQDQRTRRGHQRFQGRPINKKARMR
ncbi:hypothetical protein PPYR_01942 [Photinus pyralis]|uniref:Uncharacterized protein n=3 Tax=Photinus pyralis TaxID=7054 RepID=A0A5N4B5U3_PHOPY|nr:hypothetical protein PPYR_01942 [Photinus pyralis]